MGAADLHDVVERLGLGGQGTEQVTQGGQQPVVDFPRCGNVHRCRERVVRRLAEIHMIVRMDGRFCFKLPAQKLYRPVGDHLVGVHVALGPGAGLPNDERKMIEQFALDHLLGGFRDRAGDLRIEIAVPGVHRGRGFLHKTERADD